MPMDKESVRRALAGVEEFEKLSPQAQDECATRFAEALRRESSAAPTILLGMSAVVFLTYVLLCVPMAGRVREVLKKVAPNPFPIPADAMLVIADVLNRFWGATLLIAVALAIYAVVYWRVRGRRWTRAEVMAGLLFLSCSSLVLGTVWALMIPWSITLSGG